jgi:hypothetical protein
VKSIEYLLAIHKHHHVRSYRTLIIQDVASGLRVLSENRLQDLPHGLTFYLGGRAADMTLDVGGERNRGHILKVKSKE